MDKQRVTLDLEKLNGFWPRTAAVLCAAAVILGLPGVLLFLSKSYRAWLVADLVLGGIADPRTHSTWLLIAFLANLLGVLAPAMIGFGLFLTFRGKAARGMGMISDCAHAAAVALRVIAIGLGCLLVVRVLIYAVVNFHYNEWAYLMYAMLVSEALMALIAWAIYMLSRRFLICLSDSAANIGYTVSTGKVDTLSIPMFAATGFALLALACVILALDQLYTVTIGIGHMTTYYKLVQESHPVRLMLGVSFLCSAGANGIFALWLRSYKRLCEKTLFEARKRIN